METRDIFEQMAARYDTEERIADSNIVADKIRTELSGADTMGKRALDYGCGTGLVGLRLLDLFGSMLFADTSPQMVELVEGKIANASIKNAAARCCDFCESMPADIKADYILLSRVLIHVKDYELLLDRLFQILSPGGHLIIVDFDKNDLIETDKVHHGFKQAQLRQRLVEIGFSSAESHTFYHRERMFAGKDASLFYLDAAK